MLNVSKPKTKKKNYPLCDILLDVRHDSRLTLDFCGAREEPVTNEREEKKRDTWLRSLTTAQVRNQRILFLQ